jgi:tetrahydromethanopterin S-methyltransferase subunit F
MHFNRLAALALGAWLAGGLLTLIVATHNTQSVLEVMSDNNPDLSRIKNKLGPDEGRALLRYQAYNANLELRRNWQRVELGLGVIILLGLFFGVDGKRHTLVLCVLMLLTVIFLHWLLMPEVSRLTAGIAFVPDSQPSVARDRLASLQAGYSMTETVELALGFLLAAVMLQRRRRRAKVTRAPETDL